MKTAKILEVWEEVATGQTHVVIGADPAGGQVLINGGWKPEVLAPDYKFVSKQVSTQDMLDALNRISIMEPQLATTTSMAMAAISRLNAAGIP